MFLSSLSYLTMNMAWHEVGAHQKVTELLIFEAEWARDTVERPLQ